MPYWRLSGFYFFYFAALGALLPYWAPYLADLGYTESDIGAFVAVLMATKIIAPNLWGWIADHHGNRMRIVRFAAFMSAAMFVGVFWISDFWPLALLVAGFSFFWNASLPQVEVVTLSHLGDRRSRYAQIRLWGSVGFVLAVVTLGWLIDHYSTSVLPAVVLVLYISIWLMSLIVPGEVAEGVPGGAHLNLKATFRQPGVIAFLIVCFLLQASHGTYYGFYSLYMEHAGYDDTMVGVLWAIGVVAEVALFLYMPKLLHQFSAKLILLVSVLLAAVRWLLIGLYADVFSLVVVAQLLHAATFGSFHAAAIHLVHGFFPGKVHGRGQALYSSLSFGAGGAIGSYASGQYWSDYGPHMVFIGAAIVALVAFLFGMIGMRKIL